ncbi:HIRAN domain-containing protein [Polaribacter haliotis]|uniref:HIRAN domain-containing protein n=2 Tax=Polaribacter TaxID=52959 RepID=A0A7L8AG62_9FLAO|nr:MULTISPECIES: HIRAN domain-containing protein [Polaribacter]MDD7914122.1 HIRAN domain-containing protein [Polaribacter sp. MSW5]QOD61003.1 HIRAN domain-containing protein [Polaribacter haliotis]
MKRDYFLRFAIAGFSYYEGAIAFNKLKIGKKLKLKREPRNKYDKHAVALYRKGLKLGYIPRDKNRHLSLLLKNGGVKFDARVQKVNENEHPEIQVEVILYLLTPKKES